MSWFLNALRSFAVWWREGLAIFGAPELQASDRTGGGERQDDAEADREAWEQERARLALSPWWM